MKKMIVLIITTVLYMTMFLGCSTIETPLVSNELRLSLNNIDNLTISYDEENITFFNSDGSELVIKEYMTENKSNYHAKVTEHSGSIQISEGDKPFFKDGFSRYAEVYLPANYSETLTVTSTKGDIDFSKVDLDLRALRIDNTSGIVTTDNVTAADIHLSSTSGMLELGNIRADTILLDTTSGAITCAQLNGNVTYTSTNGDIDVKSAIGSGSYKATNSGKLIVTCTEVTGDLSFYNKNDNITLTLPKNLDFEFAAVTKNGSISTTFQQITIDERTAAGIVGNNPTVTIKAETNNGDIKVQQ